MLILHKNSNYGSKGYCQFAKFIRRSTW